MLASTHELDDGSRVRLRLMRPTDAPTIGAFLLALDADEPVREFTFYDPRERLAIAATRPGAGAEEIVGLARVEIASGDVEALVGNDLADIGLDELLIEAGLGVASRRAPRRAP